MNSNKKYWKKRVEYYNKLEAKGVKMTSDAYIKSLNKIMKEIKKEENNLSDKKVQKKVIDKIKKEIDEVKKVQEKYTNDILREGYKGFYGLAGEGIKGASVSFNMVDNYMVDEVLKSNWSGSHYSSRIYDDKKVLVKTMESEFKKAVIRGDSVEKIADKLSKRMNVSANASKRLIATELTAVNSRATKKRYSDLGVKRFEFEAFLDEKTTDECRSLNGTIIEVRDGEIGKNMPPLHPWCRSCVVPVIENDKDEYNDYNEEKYEEKYEDNEEEAKIEIKEEVKKVREVKEESKLKGFDDKEVIKFGDVEYKSKFDNKKLNDDDLHDLGERYNNLDLRELSSIEKKGINCYTQEFYVDINKALRGLEYDKYYLDVFYDKLDGINNLDEYVEMMKGVFERNKLKEDVILYRSIDLEYSPPLFKRYAEGYNIVGEKFVDNAFVSTSLGEGNFMGGDTTLKILAPKGTKGAYVGGLSDFRDEYEYLLSPGVEFEVVSAGFNKKTRVDEIVIKIINQK